MRTATIKRVEEVQARREPKLTIERVNVEALGKAYFDWQQDVDKLEAGVESGPDEGLKFRLTSDFARHYELPSYKRLEQMYDTLSRAERTDLVALAWYGASPYRIGLDHSSKPRSKSNNWTQATS